MMLRMERVDIPLGESRSLLTLSPSSCGFFLDAHYQAEKVPFYSKYTEIYYREVLLSFVKLHSFIN